MAVLLAVLVGCTEREVDDGTIVIGFALWLQGALLVGAPVALWIGLRLPKKWFRARVVLVVMAVVDAALIAPSVMLDRLVVERSGFRLQTGAWFDQRVEDVRFADVQAIRVPHSELTRRGRTPITVQLRSGATISVPQGDLLTQCLDDIADAASKAGVHVIRPS